MFTDTALLRNPSYHKPGDTAQTLDFAFLVDVTRALTTIAADAAGICAAALGNGPVDETSTGKSGKVRPAPH